MSREQTIVLFDVDGTLSVSRKKAKPEMLELLNKLKEKTTIGIVSGSDLSKVSEQLGDDCIEKFDYVFPENGTVAYKDGKKIAEKSISMHLGEDKVVEFTNFCLGYMSKITIPVKRGNFIEHRAGLINICPPGRTVSQEQRDAFGALDMKEGIRSKFVEALQQEFQGEKDLGLTYAIGGQISIDAYPHGWDKTFCLQFVENNFKEIHFFGDKTSEGGNDYTIAKDRRTIDHTVKNPEDTMNQLRLIFHL